MASKKTEVKSVLLSTSASAATVLEVSETCWQYRQSKILDRWFAGKVYPEQFFWKSEASGASFGYDDTRTSPGSYAISLTTQPTVTGTDTLVSPSFFSAVVVHRSSGFRVGPADAMTNVLVVELCSEILKALRAPGHRASAALKKELR
jgi:hypothetical protein